MTCKCYLLPGNADNQTVPGRKELILIFLIGTDSDISQRIQAGEGGRDILPPLHTLWTQRAQQSDVLVSNGELHLLRDFEVDKKQLSTALADYVSTHVGSEEQTSCHNQYFCTHTTPLCW